MEQATIRAERVNQHSDLTPITLPEAWTTSDIARLYGRSTRWAERLVQSDGFTTPLRGDSKRWSATRVIDFANGNTTPASNEALLDPAPEEKGVMRIKRSAPVTCTTSASTFQKSARRSKVGAR